MFALQQAQNINAVNCFLLFLKVRFAHHRRNPIAAAVPRSCHARPKRPT